MIEEKTLCVMIATGFHRIRTMDFQFLRTWIHHIVRMFRFTV